MAIKDNTLEDFNEIEDSLESKVNKLIEDFGASGEITAKLFRKTNGAGYEQIGIIEDLGGENTLDSHEVGQTYGGGKYRVYFAVNGVMKRTIRFTLGKEYDKYLPIQQQPQVIQENNTPKMSELISSVKELQAMVQIPTSKSSFDLEKAIAIGIPLLGAMSEIVKSIISPIADAIKSNNRPSENSNDMIKFFLPLLMEQSQNKNEIVSHAFREGMSLAREALPSNQPEKDETQWKDIVLEMVKQAPLVLSPLFQAIGTKGLLTMYPDANKVLKNPEAMQEFRTQLINEHGQEKANQILQTAGLNSSPIPTHETTMSIP